MATAAAHGEPRGLLVVTVMTTVLPASEADGVYVNANGDADADGIFSVPNPSSVIVTAVALPPKVLPLTVTGVKPQVFPAILLSVSVGELIQSHDTRKLAPVVVHPAVFLTAIVWAPLSTPLNTVPVWNAPPSMLYSRAASVGLVTVTTAFPKPRSQLIVWTGEAGDAG